MKRRLLGTFLVLFGLWPAVHHVLVRSHGTDPWKLFGWSMYCVPGPMKTVRVVGAFEDGSLLRLGFRTYSPEEQHSVDTFRERRRALGELASPDGLLEDMLRFHPEFEAVLVGVLTLELDRESAILEPRTELFTRWRDGREEALELPEEALKNLFGP